MTDKRAAGRIGVAPLSDRRPLLYERQRLLALVRVLRLAAFEKIQCCARLDALDLRLRKVAIRILQNHLTKCCGVIVVASALGSATEFIRDEQGWGTVVQPSPDVGGSGRGAEWAMRPRQRSVNDRSAKGVVGLFHWHIQENRIASTPMANRLLGLPEAQPVSFADLRERIHPDDRD